MLSTAAGHDDALQELEVKMTGLFGAVEVTLDIASVVTSAIAGLAAIAAAIHARCARREHQIRSRRRD